MLLSNVFNYGKLRALASMITLLTMVTAVKTMGASMGPIVARVRFQLPYNNCVVTMVTNVTLHGPKLIGASFAFTSEI
jgi:hypothetical protein